MSEHLCITPSSQFPRSVKFCQHITVNNKYLRQLRKICVYVSTCPHILRMARVKWFKNTTANLLVVLLYVLHFYMLSSMVICNFKVHKRERQNTTNVECITISFAHSKDQIKMNAWFGLAMKPHGQVSCYLFPVLLMAPRSLRPPSSPLIFSASPSPGGLAFKSPPSPPPMAAAAEESPFPIGRWTSHRKRRVVVVQTVSCWSSLLFAIWPSPRSSHSL